MSKYGWHLDSFSTPIADLKRPQRTTFNALKCIAKHPRVSTFDMSHHYTWLPDLVDACIKLGWITEEDEAYPWHRFALTEKGRKQVEGA